MYPIAYWKIEAVIGMTKNYFPVTAKLVKDFDKIRFLIDKDLSREGMMIIHDMFMEMKTKKSPHKMYELNEDMMDLQKRADKKLNGKISALIFLLALKFQYLFRIELLLLQRFFHKTLLVLSTKHQKNTSLLL